MKRRDPIECRRKRQGEAGDNRLLAGEEVLDLFDMALDLFRLLRADAHARPACYATLFNHLSLPALDSNRMRGATAHAIVAAPAFPLDCGYHRHCCKL